MALSNAHLSLTERGPAAIVAISEWQTAGLEEACDALGRVGILGIGITGRHAIVEPRQFVGRLRIQNRSITITPKNPVWFSSLQRIVQRSHTKTTPQTGPEPSGAAEGLHDVAFRFYQQFSETVSAGFPFLYAERSFDTCRPRGKFEVTETFRRFYMRGIRHVVACKTMERSYDIRLASVACSASRMLRFEGLPSELLKTADLLEGVVESAAFPLNPDQFEDEVNHLREDYSDRRDVVQLAETSLSVIRGEKEVWTTQLTVSGGEAKFCDADQLWERAICVSVKQDLRTRRIDRYGVELHPFRSSRVLLLSTGGPDIDPDVVVFDDGKPFAVIDAKNSVTTSPGSGDVYQIVCYTDRLKSALGILVYVSPGDTWKQLLGTTQNGAKIVAIGVSANDVARGLDAVAAEIASIRPITSAA